MNRPLLAFFHCVVFTFLCCKALSEEFTKECVEEGKAEHCTVLAARHRAKGNFKKSYEFDKKSCVQTNDRGCSQLLPDSERLTEKEQREAFEVLQKGCEKNAKVCADLAPYYVDKKEYSTAISYSKRAHEVDSSSGYPYLEFQYGNKEIAYKAGLQSCQKRPRDCGFYIRYFVSSPYFEDMLESAEKACPSGAESYGATTCVILGVYFESRQQHQKASSRFLMECERGNSTGCVLLFGQVKTDEAQRQKAYQLFCDSKSKKAFGLHADLEKNYCKNVKPTAKVPKGLIEESRKHLKSYLEEQK